MKYFYRLTLLALFLSATASAETGPNAAASDWAGAYAGVHLGVAWSQAGFEAGHSNFIAPSTRYASAPSSADVDPGLQLGYLHPLAGQWLVGGEADFSYPAMKKRMVTSNSGGTVYDQFTLRNDLQGSLRLRAGYALDKFLPFVTAGVSFASLQLAYTNESGDNYGSRTTQTGWILGAGCEYRLLDNLSTRLEYLYTDYGNAMHLNIPNVDGVADVQGLATSEMTSNVLRAAVNYRF